MVKIVKPSFEIYGTDTKMAEDLLHRIEWCARECYQSQHKITKKSHYDLIKLLMERGHTSVFDHAFITVKVVTDRGVTHEFVRHRLFAYSQESTRYCNYSGNKFGKEITVIDPAPHMTSTQHARWKMSMEKVEVEYMDLTELGAQPQMARSALANSLKTSIAATADVTEWRYFFKMRALNLNAHPQMREITVPMLLKFAEVWPPLFGDLKDQLFNIYKTADATTDKIAYPLYSSRSYTKTPVNDIYLRIKDLIKIYHKPDLTWESRKSIK